MRIRPVASLVIGVVVLLIALPSCKGAIGKFCQDSIDCEGGNDADVDACEAEANGAEDVADAYDCGDQFGKYLDCVTEKTVCKEPSTPGGKRNFTESGACKAEGEAYSTCQKAASAKGSNK